jgi:diguanylate cyclase (GGDEF)-like protein/PAS domain S-box-containing protein
VERREREQLLAAERARAVADTRVDMVEAASSEDLATSERRFRLAFENNTAGMAIAQLDGRLVDVNRSYCEMLGYTPAELLGRNLMEVTHPEDRLLTSEMNRRLTSGAVDQARYVKRYIHKDGQVLYAEVSTGFIANGGAAPVSLVASVKDVTEERALLDQLTHQALHDPLTGLPNRALFEDRIAQVRQRLTRHGGRNAVFLLDLDDFNAVNDTLGHHVGDELLIELTHRLEQATRSSDTLCRFSGDEFIYLAEGLESDAEEVADRLLGTFTEPFVVGGTSLEQRASIGVVLYDASTTDDGGLLRDADTALSEAKRQGKGRYVVFAPEMHTQASHRFELIHELRQALPSGELAMAYQPLVDLVTEEVVGFEALMRWQHPTRGPVPPDEFIPLAEQSDLIIELGAFALNEATTAAASWRPAAPTKRMPYVAINFSARQFHDPGLLSKIDAALASSGLSPSRLVLEITESVALADVETTTRVIEHVGELGAGIALDDFGTGYSSLSYLARLRPRIIKIDRSFVSPPHESLYDSTLLEAIVSLGHKLDLTVLAEGIETTGQLAHLRELGCELGQGYLFSRAVPAEQAARIVVSGRAAPPAQR